MEVLAADVDFWKWQPHPEVWLLVGCVVALGLYATKVIGPKAVPDGPVVTRRQRRFFIAGVIVLWISSDWPLHDVSEEYLYSVHMVQHFLLTMVLPPLLLFSMPEWLGRLVIGDAVATRRGVAFLTRPVVVVSYSTWSSRSPTGRQS